jgi:Mor family transcriptional regulator
VSEFVDDVQQRIKDALVRLGVSQEVAGMVGAEITLDIAHAWHGHDVYIATGKLKRARLRDQIKLKFNGRNARELARELGCGRATVYRVIKTDGK